MHPQVVMKVLCLLNTKAGTGGQNLAEKVRREFLAVGVQAEVREAMGEEMGQLARGAAQQDLDAVIAAGGDGTVSAVAAALAGTPMPLGILPLGTLNHFAKDLDLPIGLTAAVGTIATARPLKVDVADVNGRVFVNNASIGFYPHVVRRREVQREHLGSDKWVAMCFAILRVLRRFPTVRVRLEMQDHTMLQTTPFVFVGNNQYEMSLLDIGRRLRLDNGYLTVYAANHMGRFGLLRLVLRALAGRLEQTQDFVYHRVREVWIESGKRRLLMALDGEIVRMPQPLHFRTRPKALTVLVPRA
jgi:diacylglycerol kinase family enzyme